MKKVTTIGMVAASLLVFQLGAFAQTSKGILAGTVRDSSGAVVTGATVTVTSEDTGETRSLNTTSIGAYRVEGINPGLYEIKVEIKGFSPTDVRDIRVQPSVVTSYNPVLSMGRAATEEVT